MRLCAFPGFKNNAEATGSQVKPMTMAPIIAKEKANAIGRNILPSTPLNESIGMKTIKIITCPKMADFIIFEAPSKDILSIIVWRSSPSLPNISSFCRLIFIAIYSTIITAPSIIIPKSSAPRLIRLASMPKMYIIEMVKSKASGIIDAITSAERIFPKSRITVNITIIAPRIRFSATVNDVFEISSLRSRMGLIKTPSGRFF